MAVLAAALDASFGHTADLHKISRLATLSDFKELRRSLPFTNVSTKSYAAVFGRAHYYFKVGDMVGIDYAEVLRGGRTVTVLELMGQLSRYDPSYLESCSIMAPAWGVTGMPGTLQAVHDLGAGQETAQYEMFISGHRTSYRVMYLT